MWQLQKGLRGGKINRVLGSEEGIDWGPFDVPEMLWESRCLSITP